MNLPKFKKIITNKYFIIGILTIVALFVRLLNIDKAYGLWNDEILTLFFASKSFPFGIIKVFLKEDFHMPLYYIFLGGWLRVFGTNDAILRLASVFWGVLTVPAFFYLGKTYKSEKLGFLLASIATLSPILIYYSQELRFYSMVVFFATISITFFLKLLDEPNKKNIILFFLANLFILYTYTMGLIFVATEIGLLFFHFYKYKKDFLKSFIKYSSIFFILIIPYLILLCNYINGANQTLVDPLAWAPSRKMVVILLINDWFSPFFECHVLQDVQNYKLLFQTLSGSLYFLFFTSASLCFITGFIISCKKYDKRFIYPTIIAASVLLSELILQSQGHLVILTKYTIIILPIILMICSNGITLIKNKKISYALISIIFIVYIFNVINYKKMQSFQDRYGGFKYPAQKIMELKPNGDYLMALERAQLFDKYISGYHYINFDVPGVVYLYKDKTESFNFFNKEFILATNKHNAYERLIPYLMNPMPTTELQNYINSQVEKIPKGKRLIYVEGPFYGENIDFEKYVYIFVQKYLNGLIKTKDRPHYLFFYLITKISIDTKKALNYNPSLIKIKEIKIGSPNPKEDRFVKYTIYIYKKL